MPAAMPAIGPSHRDAPETAGDVGAAGFTVAPGVAGITGCDAAPEGVEADGVDAGGVDARGATL